MEKIMILQINGEQQKFEGTLTASELILQLGLQGQRIAMEVNQEILPRSQFDQFRLQENDRIEIIHAVGGG